MDTNKIPAMVELKNFKLEPQYKNIIYGSKRFQAIMYVGIVEINYQS